MFGGCRLWPTSVVWPWARFGALSTWPSGISTQLPIVDRDGDVQELEVEPPRRPVVAFRGVERREWGWAHKTFRRYPLQERTEDNTQNWEHSNDIVMDDVTFHRV